MRNYLKLKVWPVVAGLLTAFAIMMIFECGNSFIYPLPKDLNTSDPAAVWAFTASLPWTAYILVFLGWVIGAFSAGCVTTYLSGEENYRLSFVVGVILTLGGIANNFLIGHHIVFNIIGLPMFILCTYLGHRYLRGVHRARRAAE